MTSPTDPVSAVLVAALTENREAIVRAMQAGRYSGVPRDNRFGDEEGQFSRRLADWIDLLIGHLAGRPGNGALFAGQTLLELSRPERSAEENRGAIVAALRSFWTDIAGALADRIDDAGRDALHERFDDALCSLLREPRMHVRTLLVGDCLMGEIAGFASDLAGRAGVSFDPFPINARDPLQLDRTIEKLGRQRYDAIFFSPFSHARTPEIEALLDPLRSLEGGAKIDALAEAIIAQTAALLDYLGSMFECPIYIHNAATVMRATSGLKASARQLLTWRRRDRARRRLNLWVRDTVAARNARGGARQFHVIDEDELAITHGRGALGRYLHGSEFQHATELSLALAGEYASRIEMLALLNGRKLVICDLDNTLWDGVIGEGAVTHFHDRQRQLRRLKDKSGVVLSIASKNDPANVHFSGGVLDHADFVTPQISWSPKVEAIARIRRELNVQVRHMVFLDDRPDERSFAAEAFPDLLVLDPTEAGVWARIGLWADVTEGSSDVDRTRLYQEQASRESFLGGDASVGVERLDADMKSKLGLQVSVRKAAASDLKRLAELINRTNQWNMTGARTSVGQLKERQSGGALLLLAAASDRFGTMGEVCAALVSYGDGVASIDHFVLSCRVFGYGVEQEMLDEIIAQAQERWPGAVICGRYLATTQNHMARDMYSDHGFTAANDGRFLRQAGVSASPDKPVAP